MSFEHQQQQQQRRIREDEELANRLNQMNVYNSQQEQQLVYANNNPRLAGSDLTNIQQQHSANLDSQNDATAMDMDDSPGEPMMGAQENDCYLPSQQELNSNNNNNKGGNNILIVTNVDSSVFTDQLTQTKFESLFLAHDNQVTFRYLRSFRRVRLDFLDSHRAELARQHLSSFKIGDTICRCYQVQMIRPQSQQQQPQQEDANANSNYGDNLNECYLSTNQHLNIPKLTKQFLISPPASPPVGWEPVHEGSPCIDVQLLSAMANLVPGKVHEIHQGNESQPGIYVEVCEDAQFPQLTQQAAAATRRHIPKTPLPSVKSPF